MPDNSRGQSNRRCLRYRRITPNWPPAWGDPATRRFLTEDPLGFAAGINFYSYVGNNPIRRTDPTGLWFGVDDAVVIVGGGIVGATGQLIADGLVNQRLSTGRDLVAAAAGGAVTAETALYALPTLDPAGIFVAGAAGGAATNLAGYAVDRMTDPTTEIDGARLGFDIAVGAATGFIPGSAIPGFTVGRNSANAVFRQITTKAINGTISTVKPATAVTMFVGAAADRAFVEGTLVSGLAGSAYSALGDTPPAAYAADPYACQ